MNKSEIILKGLRLWVVLGVIFWTIPLIFGCCWTRSIQREDAIALGTICLMIIPARMYSGNMVIGALAIAYFTIITATLLFVHIKEGAWPLALPDFGLMAKSALILINRSAEPAPSPYSSPGAGSESGEA